MPYEPGTERREILERIYSLLEMSYPDAFQDLFEELRIDGYDMYKAKAIVQQCLDEGIIEYRGIKGLKLNMNCVVSGCDCEVGIEGSMCNDCKSWLSDETKEYISDSEELSKEAAKKAVSVGDIVIMREGPGKELIQNTWFNGQQ